MLLSIDEKARARGTIPLAAVAVRIGWGPCTFRALLEPVFEHSKLLLQWLLVELLFALWWRNV